MQKKLLLTLIVCSSFFLFLTISHVYGAGWNEVETWQFNLATPPPPPITITLATNPSGLNVRLDGGTWYASPKTFTVTSGTTHTIECQSPQSGGTGIRYVWVSWSDAGANPHSVSPSVDTTYTATYKTQYYFSVSSVRGSPTGAGWYDDGTSGIQSTVTSPSGGYVTTGWTGTGSLASGGYRGVTATTPFTITQYTTCTWNWELISWHDAETWSFNLASVDVGAWREVETWSFYLEEEEGWKDVEAWMFYLTTGTEWRSVESWSFSLNSTLAEAGWHNVETWLFTLSTVAYAYRYIVHGPYYEDGSVANCVTVVTLHKRTEAAYSFILNGTDGVADTVIVQAQNPGWFFAWNASIYNVTRVYYLTSANSEELWIYVANPNIPIGLYTFTVTDLAGVTNAYLETVINVEGQNRVVERHKLDMLGPVPFWMYWAHHYDIRLICDQGTYTWAGFIALTEYSLNLIITKDMFPMAYPGMNVTVNALRMNATWIQANYTDNQALTIWVKVDIQYKKGYRWETTYTVNNTGNTHMVNWYAAVNKTDYLVKVTALRNGDLKTWTFSCPKLGVSVNPFEGLLDALGNWPIPASQIIGLAIVLMVFAVFSYAYLPIGCILGVLTAIILTYIGWLQISWSLLGLGMAIAVFVGLAEAKKREREI